MCADRRSLHDPQSQPFQLVINDISSPGEIINTMFHRKFATGELPHAVTHHLTETKEGHSLLPADAVIERTSAVPAHVSHGGYPSSVLATGPGWVARVQRWGSSARVTVLAATEEAAERVMKEAVDGARVERETREPSVSMGFWHFSPLNGAVRTTRTIEAAAWDEARANYSAPVASAMDQLMATTPQDVAGRLVLLHGPPGTGKTSALRTLARAWRDWCQVDLVLDPERLFNEIGYLMDVAVGEEDDDDDDDVPGGEEGGRWRLLLLEDCDELIRGGAKEATGQALSRLLNLTDGLLGQGRKVLVGITTNEDLQRLHPAVARPGRCLARIEVGPLTRPEAVAWLGEDRGIETEGATLAELFALRRGQGPATVSGTSSHQGGGMYL